MPTEIEAARPSALPRLPGSKHLLARFGDQRLVEQVRRGNQLAFEVLYDRHHRPLLSFCTRMLGSTEEGEDALQQTYLSAHRALATGPETPVKFKPWLYAIARNRCLSMLRSRAAQAEPLDEHRLSSRDDLAGGVEQRADVRQLLDDLKTLPEAQREALVLSELGDLKHADVAGVLDCPQAKVKSLVFQARTSLLDRSAARELACSDVREEIANLPRLPRGGPLRRHVKQCADCRAFADQVRRQRRLMALALPVVPSAGLKRNVLAATGAGGAGGTGGGGLTAGVAGKVATATTAGTGAAGGSAAGGGFLGALTVGTGFAKIVTVAAASGGLAVGTGVAVKQEQLFSPDHSKQVGQTESTPRGSQAPTGENRPAPLNRQRIEAAARRKKARQQTTPAAKPQRGTPGPPAAKRREAPSRGQRVGEEGSDGGNKQPADSRSGSDSAGGGNGSQSPSVKLPTDSPEVKPRVPNVPDTELDGTLRDVPKLP